MSVLQTGFPPIHKIAVADSRYINRYNYCMELNGWILIDSVSILLGVNHWSYHLVDPEFGQPIGDLKRTQIDLWSDRFADRPFAVEDEEVESTEQWFIRKFLPTSSVLELEVKFRAYMERLAYSSSYEALLRIGLIEATV